MKGLVSFITTYSLISISWIQIDAKIALVLIDIQNCFTSGGSLAVAEGNDIIPVVNSIRNEFGEYFDMTIVSKDWHCSDHVSFASVHPNHDLYEVIELGYNAEAELCLGQDVTSSHAVSCGGGVAYVLNQTLWPDHCVKNTQGNNLECHSVYL